MVERIVGTNEHQNGGLRNDEIPFVLEADLDGSLSEEQSEITDLRLHRYKTLRGIGTPDLPRLIVELIGFGQWSAGASCYYAATLDGLTIHRGRWQVKSDIRSLFTFLWRDENTVADNHEVLVRF